HAPFEGKLRRVPVREPGEPEAVDGLRAEELLLAEASELADAPPAREDAAVAVADDEPGVRPGVVVVHQLKEEPEPAALAGDRHAVDLLETVVVDRAVLAVWADEVRHSPKVARSDPAASLEEDELGDRRDDDQSPRPEVAPLPRE